VEIVTAIGRLKNRDHYLEGKIAEQSVTGKPTHWFQLDREAIALAISALDYLQQVQDYEASQAK
jgi:hypothetical protein